MLIRLLALASMTLGITATSSAWAQATPPAAPTNLQVTVIQDALGIYLTWQDNADNEDSYIVERSTVGTAGPWQVVATLPPNSGDHSEGDLTDGVTYWYRVAAVNSAGSAYSNVDFGTATALPLPPPTITPVSPPPAVLPDTGADRSRPASTPWLALGIALAVSAAAASGAGLLHGSR